MQRSGKLQVQQLQLEDWKLLMYAMHLNTSLQASKTSLKKYLMSWQELLECNYGIYVEYERSVLTEAARGPHMESGYHLLSIFMHYHLF